VNEELDEVFKRLRESLDGAGREALEAAGAYLFMSQDDARRELERLRAGITEVVKAANAEAEEARRERDEALRDRKEARGRVAAEIIESLTPVNAISNQVPYRYFQVIEEYIRKQFGPTDEQVKETFEIEHRRRESFQNLQGRVRGLEARNNEGLDRLYRVQGELEALREILGDVEQ